MSATARYGSWRSPITAQFIVSDTVGLMEPRLSGTEAYWIESRPGEGGRNVVMRCARDGRIGEVTSGGFNVRSAVHEYGGGAYAVHQGTVYFCNFADQRLYRQGRIGAPRPLTPTANLRYADIEVDARRGRLICVQEDHTEGDLAPVNSLVTVGLALHRAEHLPLRLASGKDFYAAPRLSPDGMRLAWLSWNHPNMPWDGTELWTATIADDGSLCEAVRVAGGADESVFQPEWSPGGTLHFVSDRTGWWNLYRWSGSEVQALCPRDAEFAVPQWVFGLSTYAFADAERILCTYTERGIWHLAELDTRAGKLREIETPYCEFGWLSADRGGLLCWAGSSTASPAIVHCSLQDGSLRTLRRASTWLPEAGYLSRPEPIEFPTEEGRSAYGLFYAPGSCDAVAPADERPPLIVRTHGGPTSACSPSLNLAVQYWTSRGVAVLDVNYGGSSGYGRAYRHRLDGQWGVVDVADCVNGARFLVEQDRVDPKRLAIRGTSAGGYTTLCALTFYDLFRAGASLYGISDLEALAQDTHKFESHYLERLIGAYPEQRERYRARSPIHALGRLATPVIFLQGAADRVVPANQAERMVGALRDKGLPVAYLLFTGEGHGFRQGANIKRALEAELYFYSRVLGFALADPLPPLEIDNLA